MNSVIGFIAKPPWLLSMLLLAAVLLALLFWLSLSPVETTRLAHDPACDLRAGPCESSLPDGGKISFSIEPRTIPLLKPLELKVNTGLLDVKQVDVSINGVAMDMGFNQVRLNKTADGVYQGKSDLSVCIRNVMEWEAQVLVLQSGRRLILPFRFITIINPATI